MVLQELFTIGTTDPIQAFFGKPASRYALDRLLALNDSQFYKQLNGKTVRLTVAGMRNMRGRMPGMVPALMPDGDVAYFYYFGETIEPSAFGAPEETVHRHPLWRGTANIMTAEAPGTGRREPSLRQDETWLALARPDLLVAASRRETLVGILDKVDGDEKDIRTRALPDISRMGASGPESTVLGFTPLLQTTNRHTGRRAH
jgi:hypothetical protein